jgi:hypothetical protein
MTCCLQESIANFLREQGAEVQGSADGDGRKRNGA